MTGDAPKGYDEQWGPVMRRWKRAMRAVRWYAKGLMGRPRRILIEMRWRLGDEIMALPVYDALHEAFPNDTLHVATNIPELLEGRAAIAGVNPATAEPFDRVISLRDASRTRLRAAHYAALASLDRTPAAPPSVALHGLPPKSLPMEVLSGHYVALAPGGSWETKRWPRDRWQELSERVRALGMHVVVLGNAGEGIGMGVDLTGKTTLTEAAHVLRGARVAVTCDSGLMHLSLAVGTKTVALFGPTTKEVLIGPAETNLVEITNGRECSGCWNRSLHMTTPGECPLSVPICTETIEVDSVWQAMPLNLTSGPA